MVPGPFEEILESSAIISDEQVLVHDLLWDQLNVIQIDIFSIRKLNRYFCRFGVILFKSERLKGNILVRLQVEGILHEPADEGKCLEKIRFSRGVCPKASKNLGHSLSLLRLYVCIGAGSFRMDHETESIFLFERVEIFNTNF